MAVKYWSGFRRPRGMSQGVRIGLADMGALGLDPRSARLALRSLEGDGLAVVERPPGRKPVVTLVEHPIQHDRALSCPSLGDGGTPPARCRVAHSRSRWHCGSGPGGWEGKPNSRSVSATWSLLV